MRLMTLEVVLIQTLDWRSAHGKLLALVLLFLRSCSVGILEIVITVHQVVVKRHELLTLVDNVSLAVGALFCLFELLVKLASDYCVSLCLFLSLLSILCFFQELLHPQELTLLLQIPFDIFRLFADFSLSLGDFSLFLFPDFLFEFSLDLFFPREHLLLALDLVCQVLNVDVGNHLLVALIRLNHESLRVLRLLRHLHRTLRLSHACGLTLLLLFAFLVV